jgi:hypothetical protein
MREREKKNLDTVSVKSVDFCSGLKAIIDFVPRKAFNYLTDFSSVMRQLIYLPAALVTIRLRVALRLAFTIDGYR